MTSKASFLYLVFFNLIPLMSWTMHSLPYCSASRHTYPDHVHNSTHFGFHLAAQSTFIGFFGFPFVLVEVVLPSIDQSGLISISRTTILALLALLRRNAKRRPNKAIRVVHLEVLAHELLLARLVGQVPPDLVAIFFGLEQRNQVNTGPHFFAAHFAEGRLLVGFWVFRPDK